MWKKFLDSLVWVDGCSLFIWEVLGFTLKMSVAASRPLFAINGGMTSCRQISWSLEVTRLGVIMPCITLKVVLLPRCLSNFRVIWKAESHRFETSQDLAVRRLTAKWKKAQNLILCSYCALSVSWYLFSKKKKKNNNEKTPTKLAHKLKARYEVSFVSLEQSFSFALLYLYGLYGLYGHCCLKKAVKLNHSLTQSYLCYIEL